MLSVIAVVVMRLAEQFLALGLSTGIDAAACRLYAWDDSRFHLWQLWTCHLLPHSWLMVVLHGLIWLMLAPAVEQRLGSVMFACLLLLLAPLVALPVAWSGEQVGDFGLLIPIMLAWGLALAFDQEMRVRFVYAWWLLIWMGRGFFDLRASHVIVVFALLMTALPVLEPQLFEVKWQRLIPMLVVMMAFSFALGQVFQRLLHLLPVYDRLRS